MKQMGTRERLGVGAAVSIVLVLGIGGWASYHPSGGGSGSPRAPLAPVPSTGNSIEINAGGPATIPATPVPTAASTPLVVYVTGAVRHPGVYHFKNGDRLCDAIHAAGGFKAGAAEDALNLADTLEDADQVFVPVQEKPGGAAVSAPYPVKTGDAMPRTRRRGRPAVIVRGTSATADPSAPPSASGPTPPRRGRVIGKPAPLVVAESAAAATDEEIGDPDGSAAVTPNSPVPAAGKRASRSAAGKSATSSRGGKGAAKTAKFKNPGDGIVHLNSANAAQLEQLPGVGPAMSGRILEYRAQIGRFTAIEQLMDVKGVGDKKFAKMQPFLAL